MQTEQFKEAVKERAAHWHWQSFEPEKQMPACRFHLSIYLRSVTMLSSFGSLPPYLQEA